MKELFLTSFKSEDAINEFIYYNRAVSGDREEESMNSASDSKVKDYLDFLWNYFELHSNQRMQLMNFYIIIESLFVTGLIALISSDHPNMIAEISICVAMIFFSVVFFLLDRRTKNMIKLCEDSIKKIERRYYSFGDQSAAGNLENTENLAEESVDTSNPWEWIPIFLKEEAITEGKLYKEKLNISYTKAFEAEFIFFVVFGAIALIIIA